MRRFLLPLLATLILDKMQAQVTSSFSFFQYSMTPIQPTSLPYNYLDKFERRRGSSRPERGMREDTRISSGWYINGSSRSDYHPQTGFVTSGVLAADRISDPNRLGLKIGGGVMYNDLQLVRIASPFIHASVGKDIDDEWRILGGAGYRFSTQRPTDVLYKDINDPKIALAEQTAHRSYSVVGVSAAAVHIRRLYFGVGINRILGNTQFTTADQRSFTELNILGQFVLRGHYKSNFFKDLSKRGYSLRSENPNRGLFSNINMSVAMRYLFVPIRYPMYAQMNCRTTLTADLWTGLGINTAGRVQLQFGYMKIPVFKMDTSSEEYHIWVAYDIPNSVNPQHGIDLNFGYYF